jgi:hypothetical protein
MMTDKELKELMCINDSVPCPIGVERTENGRVRIDWGTKDPLDFIVLSEGQAAELIDKLAQVVNRRVERDW